ncbi:MAG: hypothetical protein KYX62_14195 [Pseudomonadota bacterium]|nr:hypothetical protein [Pseudomonadota bacterium]
MQRLTELPLPDDRVPGEMALWVTSGRYDQNTLIVYEQARDFLSAPPSYVVLDCGGDAWLISDSGDDYGLEPGIYRHTSSEHAAEDQQHLILIFSDRTLEVICYQCVIAGYQMHAASAGQALRNHLSERQPPDDQ